MNIYTRGDNPVYDDLGKLYDELTAGGDGCSFDIAGIARDARVVIKALESELAVYHDAEAEDRLDIHPCREGNVVYMVCLKQDHYAEEPYQAIEVKEYRKSMLKEMGKTVFLSLAKAETALSKGEAK